MVPMPVAPNVAWSDVALFHVAAPTQLSVLVFQFMSTPASQAREAEKAGEPRARRVTTEAWNRGRSLDFMGRRRFACETPVHSETKGHTLAKNAIYRIVGKT